LLSWTIRLVVPPHCATAADAYTTACRQELASPLRPSTLEEVRWFFEQQRASSEGAPLPGRDAAR
jgi:hypothetical protein